jgi:hypothetical protein
MFWLSRISEHSSYAGGLLGPMLITAAGLGLLFVPMALVSLTRIRNADTGVASSLVNVGQQVGGSIGLALLGTVAWSAAATSLRSQTAAAAGQPLTAAAQTRMQHHALAAGFSHGFLVCAAIGLLALIIALAAIRVTREDLSGVDPLAAPAG